MKCPACEFHDSKVIDSRTGDGGDVIRRRRECLDCGYRFTTYERLGERPIIVTKSDGSSEEFDRQKLMRGILTACAKRPVTHDQMESMINEIESELRASSGEVGSKQLGEMVLSKLANIDDVAYIRFASVYKDFQSVDQFADALKDFRG